ncbi:TetR family transcriptional regulator [Streptomyces spectabilis]|uniref:AcrR family transcriptional regulator n=1 Tax=Streptomyces spectabilis TaxID=68270 RepID=A0A5P2XBR6_STRST|nr:TetR family transcriptional regulator [Streptomyces spectabilis]MBB5103396.1 AcrR family transcriptional regulator [Streptomyces spectabilis]MCI3902586.1 TetR family transcriptional regulator [Streptomyces spectabilis]QEV59912.1 TetR/AcrR family transcriptional regulator [Streptomyces spectabilis]GGV48903.1 TetR family transcriptional regulator [Streptomyces spectabilis]
MAPTETLTAERILATTEDVLRRHGAAKATVVDVARALGVSHAAVYRHFRTKAALREAVTKRWLDRTTAELKLVVEDRSIPADERLRGWFTALFAAKRKKAGDDPELFATYEVLLGENSDVVEEHIADLVGHLRLIVEEGVARGELVAPVADPELTARAVFDATGRFHDPCYSREWFKPGIDEAFTAVVELTLAALRP